MTNRIPTAPARQSRGGALVEFALLNIVLVPLLVYAVFLMDVPHLMLEGQETVIASLWDFTTRNTENGSDANEVFHVAKPNAYLWSDHSSAYESGIYPDEPRYKDMPWVKGGDADHYLHHTGFGAQYAFNFKNGPDTQLNCNEADRRNGTFDPTDYEADLEWVSDPGFKSFSDSPYALGGMADCFMYAYVYNYVVPKSFLPEFSHLSDPSLSHMEYRGEGPGSTGAMTAHNWQGDVSPVNNIEVYEQFAVSFNTWALRNGSDNGSIDNTDVRQPGSGHPWMQRLAAANKAGPANATWIAAKAAGVNFSTTALSEDLMAVPTGFSALGLPNPVDLYLQARHDKNNPDLPVPAPTGMGFGGKDYESTPYKDVNDLYQQARSDRGNHYLGCATAETYPCN